MKQFNVDKQTMEKQHKDASMHHEKASEYHKEAANLHKDGKHLEGFASAHQAQGHSDKAGQCAAEASRHSAGISSSQGAQDQYGKKDPDQQRKDNEPGYRPQQR